LVIQLKKIISLATPSNFIGGVLIGIATETWLFVIVLSSLWGVVKCYFAIAVMPQLKKFTMELYIKRNGSLIFNSPTLTFYILEYLISSITACVIGFACFFVKALIF